METVVLVIHLMLVAAMIAIILMQRSEGGALGIGGGGNFMAARGTGNILTRTTTILAAGFFLTSIALTFIARNDASDSGLFENLPANQINENAAEDRPEGGVLNLLGGGAEDTPAVPDDAGDGAAAPDEGGDAGDPIAIPGDAGEGGAGDGGAAPVVIPNN